MGLSNYVRFLLHTRVTGRSVKTQGGSVTKLLATLCFGFALAPLAAAQGQYLDDYIIRIKPEKRVDFDAVSRKIAEANRKAKGDAFIAFERIYGADYTAMFVSQRQNYAAIEEGGKAFMSAINEAYGVGGMKKMMMDATPAVQSAFGRLRIRRPDLSSNAPKDAAAYNKLVGSARFLRTTEYHVRAGRAPEFEKLSMQVKEAYDKNSEYPPVLVSQAVAGVSGTIYYVSTLAPSMATFDSSPSVRKLVGEEEYMRLSNGIAECVDSSETSIFRMVPEWSNPPKEVADVAPDFWHPKAVSMAQPKPKTKPVEAAKAGQ